MKTERRHELQTNTLADHLGKWIVAIKPYTNFILIAVIGVIVLVLAWQYASSSAVAGRGESWDEFNVAFRQYAVANRDANQEAGTNAEKLSRQQNVDDALRELTLVIDKTKGQPVEYWAQFLLGNHYQTAGTRALFYDREDAQGKLKKAVDHFKSAAATDDLDLKQRAQFGLGVALESGGDLQGAIAAYDALVELKPTGPFAATAREYSERLQKTSTRTWYTSYFSKNPDRIRKDEDNSIERVIDKDKFKPLGSDFLDNPGGAGPLNPNPLDPTPPGALEPGRGASDAGGASDASEGATDSSPADAGKDAAGDAELPEEPAKDASTESTGE